MQTDFSNDHILRIIGNLIKGLQEEDPEQLGLQRKRAHSDKKEVV